MLDKMQDKTLLKVEGLTKNFGGVAAIVKVSFELQEGEGQTAQERPRWLIC
jgi:ABC-type branched-subunit amino acid transport system ATPase component